MSDFPRSRIEDLSVSRLIVGTNWFLGFTHTSAAKAKFIKETMGRSQIAAILQAFLAEGVDTLLGARPEAEHLLAAIRDAEDRVGRPFTTIGTPGLKTDDSPESRDANARTLDAYAEIGVRICMPHQATTDAMVDRKSRSIPGMAERLAMIRQRGMLPGLSTHMPETVPFADRTGLDVATYIQIYNAAGFLMQVEADWVNRVIWDAAQPVISIKPLAAGRLLPIVGLGFVWATLRERDMVCIGTMTPDEAREVIELSRAILERRRPVLDLQATRSKESLEAPPRTAGSCPRGADLVQ